MTEDINVTKAEDIFGALSVSRILVAALENLGEIVIPTDSFINAATENRELKVDYNFKFCSTNR